MKQQILVIDDSKAISFLLQTILGKKYQVITSSDGYAAMQWLSRRNFPDIIIANPELPAMYNWELVENLTSSGIYGNIPLIVLSSLSQSETQGKCEELGIVHYFQKPFNPIELVKCVDGLTMHNVKGINNTADRLQKVG